MCEYIYEEIYFKELAHLVIETQEKPILQFKYKEFLIAQEGKVGCQSFILYELQLVG